jgi:UDP-glucuronate 4-epimerase
MKHVLLTGCAGFIAAKTAEMLLARGYAVAGIDNMNEYYDVRLKRHRLEALLPRKEFTFVEGDIENYATLQEIFAKHQFCGVVNLAARAGVRYSLVDPFVYERTNALGTLNLLHLCKEHKVPKFVLASTSSLYAGQPMPFVETLPVNEPISPYAASKKSAEVICYTYHHLYRLDVSIVRYFTVYGPAGRPDMSILRFIRWIDEGTPIELLGDGTQSRDFTYVDDIAEGTVRAFEKPTGYEIINLGGSDPHPLNHVIALMEQFLGKKALRNQRPFHHADMKDTWADNAKARRLLKWEAKVPVAEGIRRSVEWYVQNKAWAKDIALPPL